MDKQSTSRGPRHARGGHRRRACRAARFCTYCGAGFTTAEWARANFCASCGERVRGSRAAPWHDDADGGRRARPRPSRGAWVCERDWDTVEPVDSTRTAVCATESAVPEGCEPEEATGVGRQIATAMKQRIPAAVQQKLGEAAVWARANPTKAALVGLGAGAVAFVTGSGLKFVGHLLYGAAVVTAIAGVVVVAVAGRKGANGYVVGGQILLAAAGMGAAGLACDVAGTVLQVGGVATAVGSTGVLAWQGCRKVAALRAARRGGAQQGLPGGDASALPDGTGAAAGDTAEAQAEVPAREAAPA